MKSYAPYIDRLAIVTSTNCDFSQFSNLHTLILCNENSEHLTQIQPKTIPNLVSLSFVLGSKFTPPSQLLDDVFSNKFSSLRHVNLVCVNKWNIYAWKTSASLQFVSIFSESPMISLVILVSCPNLHHLQLHVLRNNPSIIIFLLPSNHPIQRFTLWTDIVELTSKVVDTLLTYTPNVRHLYLQTVCRMPFIDLTHGFVNGLHHLSRFDCHVKEMVTSATRIGNLTTIHQIHSSFNGIQCIEETDEYRIFATE